ncbi:MAG: hypothetical protein EON55_03130 [Alphaproteobacteria bacterium]|nr:MAG: hypothetical protein EON55_03130 [Alphaproteobacteria bacterium]
MLDASTIVDAASRGGSVPDRAVRLAFTTDRIAISDDMTAELLDALYRPEPNASSAATRICWS